MKPWRTTELREFRADRTAKDVARRIGRCPNVVRNEARRRGLPLAREHRGWPVSTRARALRMLADGMSYVAVQRVTSVPASTVRAWEKKDPLRAWMRKFRAYAPKASA
jgi:hypothetical protein